MKNLGDLYDSVRDSGVYLHTHLNKNNRPGTGEVEVNQAGIRVNSYLDIYDGKFLPGSAVGGKSLLGRRTILAHSVHCQDVELARMAETGTSIAHCPVSQLFLGSGTMPWRRTVASGVNIAAGTDFGAGDEWLIPRVLGDAFKVHISEPGEHGVSLHPAEMLFTGTLAGAPGARHGGAASAISISAKRPTSSSSTPCGTPALHAVLNDGIRSGDEIWPVTRPCSRS